MDIEKPKLESKTGPSRSTSFYLSDSMVMRIKALATEKGISASEVVQSMLNWALEAYDRPDGSSGDSHDSGADSESTPSHT